MKIRATLNPPVFFSSILLIFGFVLFGALMPQRANTLFSMIQKGIIEKLAGGGFTMVNIYQETPIQLLNIPYKFSQQHHKRFEPSTKFL